MRQLVKKEKQTQLIFSALLHPQRNGNKLTAKGLSKGLVFPVVLLIPLQKQRSFLHDCLEAQLLIATHESLDTKKHVSPLARHRLA